MRHLAATIAVALGAALLASPAHGEDTGDHASREKVDVRALYESSRVASDQQLAASAPCPDVIVANYTLPSDLTCTLLVNATDVTIDLAGHTLSGRILGHWAGGAPGLTVRNGTMRAPAGVEGSMAIVDYAGNVTLDKLEVRGYTDFAVQLGGSSTVKRSRFVHNEVGLDLFWGGSIRVIDSTFIGNRIGVVNGSDNNSLIKRNVFERNVVGVRIWDEDRSGSSSVRVEENQFRENGTGLRIVAFDAVENLQVLRNRFVYSRGSAIQIDLCLPGLPGEYDSCGGENMAITHNVLFRNGFGGDPQHNDGLTVTGPPEGRLNVTVSGTTADHNADLGIDAEGVADGGGNRAVRNRNVQQCVGVACT